MNLYEPGDVVWLPFPYKVQEVFQVKIRPGVILKVGEQLMYAVVQVTTKNRSYSNKGLWVSVDSDRGYRMGILKDSFINLDVIMEVHEDEIIKPCGKLNQEDMEQIELLLSQK